MKIAFIVDEFPCLSQTFVLNQIVGLIKMGYDVHVFAEKKGSDIKTHDDYKKYDLLNKTYYYCIPKNIMFRLLKGLFFIIKYTPRNHKVVFRSLNIFRYKRKAWSFHLLFLSIPFIERRPFDIIHCQFGTLGLKAVLLRQIGAINCKIVTSIRGFDVTMILKEKPGVYHELFRVGDFFLPVCQSLKERLVHAGCDKMKIAIHYSGIDCSKFEYSPRRRINDEYIMLLTVARLVEKKGVAYAIEAVASLISKGKKIVYTIVGDGMLRENLQQIIARLGIEQQVKLIGWKTQEEVKILLQKSHVLVAPSLTSASGDQEGIPNVIKEAMASGLPVISTFHSGIPELVTDGVTGILVPEKEIHSLADALAYLISHPEICNKMGKSGRKYIEENFDINKLNNTLVQIYQQLLGKKAADNLTFKKENL
ncbi:MAG: colanic acid biosynthesis glycosyltransferase WcaL [Candidatus Brocadia sapporoensis]|nr:colanic acid biosynthesis glycosyltransferase WcaL [Candidatus Brocadia sp.]GJQ22790.1 MAG: colanic acid biosynthesis glycosyltransferase WcaL [Candidatus Brocadia sapporoensis]